MAFSCYTWKNRLIKPEKTEKSEQTDRARCRRGDREPQTSPDHGTPDAATRRPPASTGPVIPGSKSARKLQQKLSDLPPQSIDEGQPSISAGSCASPLFKNTNSQMTNHPIVVGINLEAGIANALDKICAITMDSRAHFVRRVLVKALRDEGLLPDPAASQQKAAGR